MAGSAHTQNPSPQSNVFCLITGISQAAYILFYLWVCNIISLDIKWGCIWPCWPETLPSQHSKYIRSCNKFQYSFKISLCLASVVNPFSWTTRNVRQWHDESQSFPIITSFIIFNYDTFIGSQVLSTHRQSFKSMNVISPDAISGIWLEFSYGTEHIT